MPWPKGNQDFAAIAVVTENGGAPCGSCRQALAEFNPRMLVIVADTAGNRNVYRLDELLPHVFGPEDLGGAVSGKLVDWWIGE